MIIAHFQEDSIIQQLDPRVRIMTATLFAVILAMSQNLTVILLGLTVAILLTWLADFPINKIKNRLISLNLLTLLLFLVLPFSSTDSANHHSGLLSFSYTGLWQATMITLKSNSILLIFTALLNTIESMTFGYALYHLKLPQKLIHLLLFTVRYLDVLQQEYLRLRRSMLIRGFHPKTNRHTYRSFAYLVSLLLIKSLDRSERILAAMKCRGFQGQLFILKQFSLKYHDKVFCLISLCLLLGLLGIEWLN
ncbi:MAG: cobalt ECF transporter T component CbiQ [Beggiatoa sp. IS2]|nr:MAG: cobalt ECF transporter T component CbiQ [Beggiatoa sp. IS2]